MTTKCAGNRRLQNCSAEIGDECVSNGCLSNFITEADDLGTTSKNALLYSAHCFYRNTALCIRYLQIFTFKSPIPFSRMCA
jgi:hypothetical protein